MKFKCNTVVDYRWQKRFEEESNKPILQIISASPGRQLDAGPIEPISAFLFCVQLEDPNDRG